MDVAAIFIHEDYRAELQPWPPTSVNWVVFNDIAVLELAEEMDLDTYTPACMAQVSISSLLTEYTYYSYIIHCIVPLRIGN